MAKAMTQREWLEVVSQLATPIDFEALIADGVLKRRSKLKYVVLDGKRVPAHLWRQVNAVQTVKSGGKTRTTITVSGSTTAMKKMLVEAVGATRAAELIAQVAANGTIQAE